MTGLFAFGYPGDPIELHRGAVEVVGIGTGEGRVWLAMDGSLRINWEVEIDEPLELGNVVLRIARPDLGLVDVSVDVNHSDGRGTIAGADLGANLGLQRLVVHWVNLPPIYSVGPPRPDRIYRAGQWRCQAAGWELAMFARPDLNRVETELSESRCLALTHVGELTRIDESDFSADEAREILFGFQLCLSVALGRWVAPALPVGFDKEDRRIWEQWAPWRCDFYSGFLHWWDPITGDDLSDFVSLFIRAWATKSDHDLVWHMAYHVIAANHSGTTVEGRIMLAQSALEYLAWTKYVLTGQVSRKDYKRLGAAEHLRRMLLGASIPTDIPSSLPALQQLANEHSFDGPQAVTWLRNRLVHPKDPGEPYRIKNLIAEAWLLSMNYSELLLLHQLNYRGSYLPRFPLGRFAHDREPVPWS
jgi:hypothetical protein